MHGANFMSGLQREKLTPFTAFRFLLTKDMFGNLLDVRFSGHPISPAIDCVGVRGWTSQGKSPRAGNR